MLCCKILEVVLVPVYNQCYHGTTEQNVRHLHERWVLWFVHLIAWLSFSRHICPLQIHVNFGFIMILFFIIIDFISLYYCQSKYKFWWVLVCCCSDKLILLLKAYQSTHTKMVWVDYGTILFKMCIQYFIPYLI